MIYISHKYNNDPAEKADIERIIRELLKEDPSTVFVSPVHAYSFLYEELDYEAGLRLCLKLLDKCDKMYVYNGVTGDYTGSQGVKAEMRYCKENAIPYEIR